MKMVVVKKKDSIIRMDYYFIFILILLPLILPSYFRDAENLYIIKVILTYTSLILMACLYGLNFRSFDKSIFLVAVWYIILIYSTFINNGDMIGAWLKSLRVVLMCLTIGIVVKSKEKQTAFLYAMRDLAFIFFFLNLITMVVYPNGIPNYTLNTTTPFFLYGNVNVTIKYIFSAMCCSSILDARKKTISLPSIVFFGGMLWVFVFVYHTVTTFLGILFVLFWFIFRNKIQKRIAVVYSVSIISITVIEVLIAVVTNTGIMTFIAQIFGKDTDFSGRAILWTNVTRRIKDSFIWGHGLQPAEVLRRHIGNSSGSHNYYLDKIYEIGLIGIIIFLCIILFSVLIIKKDIIINEEIYIMFGYWIAYLVMCLAEPFSSIEFLFIPLIYCIIVSMKDKNREKLYL